MATQEDPEELCGAPEDWVAQAYADAAAVGGDPAPDAAQRPGLRGGLRGAHASGRGDGAAHPAVHRP